jgi:hypothetical protein
MPHLARPSSLAGFAVCAALFVACAGGNPQDRGAHRAMESTTMKERSGQAIYRSTCLSCHQSKGEGMRWLPSLPSEGDAAAAFSAVVSLQMPPGSPLDPVERHTLLQYLCVETRRSERVCQELLLPEQSAIRIRSVPTFLHALEFQGFGLPSDEAQRRILAYYKPAAPDSILTPGALGAALSIALEVCQKKVYNAPDFSSVRVERNSCVGSVLGAFGARLAGGQP